MKKTDDSAGPEYTRFERLMTGLVSVPKTAIQPKTGTKKPGFKEPPLARRKQEKRPRGKP